MIETKSLRKVFTVHKKEPGLKGSLRALLRRRREEVVALAGVTLSVGAGEIVGLIGANGAGKTTLVKMLSGILHPTSGEARVLGAIPWRRENEFRRRIALIMGQKAQLWWDLPAADCFLLLREIYRLPEAEFRRDLDYLVSALKVGEKLKIQIRRLSLGERMKMELIAALLHRPKVVFLDEPTIGLDLAAQRAIREFLLEYRAAHQPAMILTSHYMEDIERLCGRVLLLREGRLVYDGPLKRISADFGVHKIVTVHLAEGWERPREFALPVGLGELLPGPGSDGPAAGAASLKVKAPRETIAAAAAFLLSHLPVRDIEVEEEDVGVLIEKILREGLGKKT